MLAEGVVGVARTGGGDILTDKGDPSGDGEGGVGVGDLGTEGTGGRGRKASLADQKEGAQIAQCQRKIMRKQAAYQSDDKRRRQAASASPPTGDQA